MPDELPLTFPNPWCPHTPHPTQQAFLDLNCLEAFFGGAAGGGKSQALLMAALQYVDRPGYAALILRRDLQRLALANGLIPRSHEWLANTSASWNDRRRQWTFPLPGGRPATLTFGYLSGPFDRYRYASSEYQYLGFDELTELREEDYLFLFSRLRRMKGADVALRVRSASNPGNLGHLWVKERFVPQEPEVRDQGPAVFFKHGRAFIPSRMADNPSLDAEGYLESLAHLPPLERQRLMHGDWSVQQAGLFQQRWLRYFSVGSSVPEGPVLQFDSPTRDLTAHLDLLTPSGSLLATIPPGICRRFVTVDPAGTPADGAGESRRRAPSHTVVQVWEQPRRADLSRVLLLRHQVRDRVAFDGLCQIIRAVHGQWRPERIWIEDEKLGHAAVSILTREGLPIEVVRTQGQDKVARSAWLSAKMSRGEIYLPRYNTTWRLDFEAELLAWTGERTQPSDQIDAAAYAAFLAESHDPRPIRMERAAR